MTKGQRKQAIKDCLVRLQAAEQAYNEAYAQMREFERNDKTRYVADCFIMMAYAPYERRIEECRKALSEARNEYNTLTSCKAWKQLADQVRKELKKC